VRHLVSNSAEASEADSALMLAARFAHPEGYEFDPDLTTEVDRATELVFVRD
jgi:hypothetical protein